MERRTEQQQQPQQFTPQEWEALARVRKRLHRQWFVEWAITSHPRAVFAIAFVLGLILADILMIALVLLSGARL